MSRLLVSFSMSLSLALLACGGSSTPARVTTTAPAEQPATDCPMDVPGTSVTVEDTTTGAAFVFVTTGDVARVRDQVSRWADAHNANHGAMGPLPTGEETGGGGHDHHQHGAAPADPHAGHGAPADGDAHAAHGGVSFHQMIAVHSRAAMSEIDGGARLDLITFPDQVGALREELRKHASHLSSGGCAMHAEH